MNNLITRDEDSLKIFDRTDQDYGSRLCESPELNPVLKSKSMEDIQIDGLSDQGRFATILACVRSVGIVSLKVMLLIFCFIGQILSGQGTEPKDKNFSLKVPNKIIRVGLFQQECRHDIHQKDSSESDKGEPVRGYSYDYLQQLKRYVPWTYEYTDLTHDWPDAIRLLEEGKVDLVMNVRKTPDREEKFAFSQYPLGLFSTILTVKKGDNRYHAGDYKNWNGIRIGLLKKNSWEKKFADFAKEKGFSWRPVLYDSADQMLGDLQQGTVIDVVLSNNMRHLHDEWLLEQLDTAPFYIAVRKDKNDLLAELDRAMGRLTLDFPTFTGTLWEEYFSDSEINDVVYTEKEREFIRSAQLNGDQFTAILNPDRYPASSFTNGKHQGFLKNIADEIVRRTGLNIKLLPLQTPQEYKDACFDPDVDIVFDAKQDLREAEKRCLILSRPYITLSVSILYNKKNGSSLDNVALVEGYRFSNEICSKLAKDVKFHRCKTVREAIDLVNSGECDATCLLTSAAELAVREDPYDHLGADLLHGIHIKLAVGVRDSCNPLLASIINKSVTSISDHFVDQIRQKGEKSQKRSYSLIRLIHRHPIPVLGLPCLALLLVCVFLWRVILARRRQYRLGAVFSNLPFRYFIADESGKVLQYSYGSEIAPCDFRTLDDIKEEQVRLSMKELVVQTLQSDEVLQKIYMDGGQVRLSMASCLPGSFFGHPAVIVVSRDITELQEVRNAARRNDEYFRLTLRSIGDGVITTDEKGNVVMLNSAAERMIGLSMAKVIGQPHTKFFHVVSIGDWMELDSPVLRTLRTDRSIEMTGAVELLSFDGKSSFPIACSSSPIHNEQGKVIGAVLVFRDITEENKRRQEIQAELANWEAMATIAQTYRFRCRPETREVIAGSKDLSNVWPIKDGIAAPASEWVCSEDLDAWYRSYHDIIEGKKDRGIFEFRVRREGKTRYFRGFIRGAVESNGEITGLVQETTEYVEARQKQDATQNLWTACINAMPVTLFVKSAKDDFRYEQVNQNFADLMGCKIEDIVGRTDDELFNRPEDAEHFRRCDEEVMIGGKVQKFHETAEYAQGDIRHFMTVKVPVTDMNGKPALLGMSLDETDDFNRRKKLDDMLEDWELVSKVAKIASYRLDDQMRILSQTDRVIDFWPMRNGNPVDPEDYLHPNDIEPYRAMYESVFSGKKEEASMLCHIPRPDGMRYIRLFIKRNRPHEISGLLQDITEKVVEQKKREALLAMWKNVIDSLPVIFLIKNVDDNYRYLQANGNFTKIFGRSAQEIIGLTEKDFFLNARDAQMVHADDVQVAALGKRKDFIECIHDKDGILRRFQSVKLPSVNEAGQRIIISMALDITEAQETSEIRQIISSALEILFSSEDLADDLQTVLKSICEFIGFECACICYKEEETTLLRAFTMYLPEGEKLPDELVDFSTEDPSGKLHHGTTWEVGRNEAVHLDFSNEHDLKLARYLVPSILERAEKYDIRGVHVNTIFINGKKWGTILFMARKRKVKNLSENEKRLLNLTAHIIEMAIGRKKTLGQLEKALHDALAADKAKSYFLSSMSHEIRTPLNAVIGFTDLLKDSELERYTQLEYLGAISDASQALLMLLNDILDLSKLTAGKFRIHHVLINIKELIDEMNSIFLAGVKKKGLKLVFRAQGIPDLYLDKPRFRQILFNLVGNAIKFTDQGEVVVSFAFEKTENEYGKLTLKVSDTGIGIEPEDREILFEPFIQMSRMRGTNASGAGTGLGLAIVKKIVEFENGKLSLQSEVGRGSTFTIVWPNVKSNVKDENFLNSPAIGLLENYQQSPEVKSEENLNTGLTHDSLEKANQTGSKALSDNEGEILAFGPRVLLVDDSEITLNILDRMLTQLKVPHSSVRSGKEALAFLEKMSFDIVLTDIIMPEMNGDELAKAIRLIPEKGKIVIVAMSTENESIMYDKSLFDKFMLKPIVRNALCECLFEKKDNKLDDLKG